MGFHVSWIVVRGRQPAELRAQLGLRETRQREFVPESDVTEVLLPSGWHLIFFNDPQPPELGDETLCRISTGAEVMAFVVEEGSMVSLATGYAGGERAWEVVHDSSHGLDHLEVTGTPPSSFTAVRDRLLGQMTADEQHCDHLFDVPAELSKMEAGFRHDEDIAGMEGDAFVVLERA